MRCLRFAVSTVLASSVIFSLSQTATAGEGLGISAKAGTLGVGAELSVSLVPHTRLRGGLNYLNFSFDSTLSDVEYDFESQFNSVSLLLDVHPFGGAFFLTGGVYLNNNKVGVSGTMSQDAVPPGYADYAYLTDMVSLDGDVEFNPVAPYAGLGWRSNSNDSGWGLALELGVLFQGPPDVTNLRINAPVDVSNMDAVNQFLAEQEKEIEDELDWFQFYPVASAMLTYHF